MQLSASITVSNIVLFLVVALATSPGIDISVLKDVRNVACLRSILSILMVVFIIGSTVPRLLVLNFVD